MKELELKYGCNPNQKPLQNLYGGGELPIKVLSGKPGYINFLDAFNGWQLVRELKAATDSPRQRPSSMFPGGSGCGPSADGCGEENLLGGRHGYGVYALANAYARARGADRMSSFGDFIALSDVCDAATASIIKREVLTVSSLRDMSPMRWRF